MWVRRVNVFGLATACGLILIWQLLLGTGLVHVEYLPAPSGIARALWSLTAQGGLAGDIGHTVGVTLLSWVIASAMGLTFGLLIGSFPEVWRYSMASVELLRSMPSVAFVPVSLLVFAFTVKMELALTVYIAQWLVLVNTVDGVRAVSPQLLEVAKMLRMSWPDRMRKIVLPAAMPVIIVGLRLGLSVSLVLAVVSEMIGNPAGLGYQLIFEQRALQPERMFAYLVVIGGLGVLLNAVLVYIARGIPGAQRRGEAS
jgi:ABC-type nitrate/sulfonate/bicarbonate transport system permease component